MDLPKLSEIATEVQALKNLISRDSDKDKEEVLELVVEDLRRLYDHLDNNWTAMKTRVLTVAFGEVAIISFILSGKGIHPSKLTSAEQIFCYTGGFSLR